MKVLVAGGCGFIGSNLSIFLKKKNYKIVSVDNLSKKYCFLNEQRLKKYKIKNYRINLCQKKNFTKINFNPDIIIDCAAEPAVEISSKNPEKVIQNNLISTLNLLNFCREKKSKFIFLSSSRIYPIKQSYKFFKSNKLKTYSEITSTEGVKTIYGFTKYSSELLINEYSYAYGIKFLINRVGLTTGPWQFGKVEQGLVSLWLWKHYNKKKLNYIGFGGSGKQIRDVLYIDDLCDLIFLQIKRFDKIFNQLFCVGGSKKSYFDLKSLTHSCEKITKNQILIKKIKKTSKYDIPYYISSNLKLKKIYKWTTKHNLDEILQKTFKWMKQHKKTLERYF